MGVSLNEVNTNSFGMYIDTSILFMRMLYHSCMQPLSLRQCQ